MSKSTDRVIRIKAEDDASSHILAVVRTMRGLATAIRSVRTLMIALNQLQKLEIIQVAALASAYKYLAIMKTAAAMIGVGGAILAIAASFAMMGAGAGPIPVSLQTARGTSRQVSASGLAVVHAGETVSRGAGGTRGGGFPQITINIASANMSYRAGIEETVELLDTLIYQGMRRYRH